jgi:hypothetical protein
MHKPASHALASIEQRNDTFELLDDRRSSIFLANLPNGDLDDRTVEEILYRLKVFAKSKTFLSLHEDENGAEIAESILVTWGVIENALLCPQSDTNTTPTERQKVYTILEDEDEVTMWMSVFDVGISGTISLLTKSSHSGIEISLRHRHVLGKEDATSRLIGLKLGGSNAVPGDGPPDETIVVVASSCPLDLSFWNTRKFRHQRVARLRSGPPERLRYHIKHVNFKLEPRSGA